MIKEQVARYNVVVVGAGPAGLFAARELASRGFHTVILNRDIKPGGLAEYGIYPDKLRMKEGLRNQFRQILSMDDIEYYGNVMVGSGADLSFDDLHNMGFQAVLVTVGAQSTKRVGIPGEELTGVYHAKDIVYHYNLLPPFSETTYRIGKHVAVIGVGNVMMDITRWLIEDQGVEDVVAIARRGPAEVKFDRKELESVVGYLDMDALKNELERVMPVMQEIGQDAEQFMTMIQDTLRKAAPTTKDACFALRFLSSPARINSEDNMHVSGLTVEENMLTVGEDGEIRAKGTGQFRTLNFDTVIFAIGDVVDPALGLPVQYGEFVKNYQPRFPIEGISYEAYDPASGTVIPDVFLAGWARRPSAGLVGVARKDATNAAHAVAEYLQTIEPTTSPVVEQLVQRLAHLEHPVVDKAAWVRLDALERARASEMGVASFKYGTNQQMLEVLGLVQSGINTSTDQGN